MNALATNNSKPLFWSIKVLLIFAAQNGPHLEPSQNISGSPNRLLEKRKSRQVLEIENKANRKQIPVEML